MVAGAAHPNPVIVTARMDVAADVLSRHEAEWSATFGKPTFGKQADAHADAVLEISQMVLDGEV